MPKQTWAILTCLLVLGSMAPSGAESPEAPATEAADVLPCNIICHFYLEWSHRLSSLFGQPAPPETAEAAPATAAPRAVELRGDRSKQSPRAGVAGKTVPNSASVRMPRVPIPPLRPTISATAADAAQPPAAAAHSAPKAAAAADSDTKTAEHIPQLPAASPAAEQSTAATAALASPPQANDREDSNRPETAVPGDAEKVVAAPPSDTGAMVVLLLARPEIKSISDLANRNVAMDDSPSASNEIVRSAISAAGAKEVQLSRSQTTAVHRLLTGEVPAAVLNLISPEGAREFPDIVGFNIFRIPLSPKAPL